MPEVWRGREEGACCAKGGDAMSFYEWPEFMVLPSKRDFKRGDWECGTRGCAYGWLCTAFDVPVCFADGGALNGLSNPPEPSSPAGIFAETLAEEMGRGAVYRRRLATHDVCAALSDAFETDEISLSAVEKAWVRAAKRVGYTVNAGRFR
jgi:hypothetical protein